MKNRNALTAGLVLLTLGSCDLLVQTVYETDLLIGTWHWDDGQVFPSSRTYTFRADGTGVHTWDSGLVGSDGEVDLTWTASAETQVLSITEDGYTDDYPYSIEHNILDPDRDVLRFGEMGYDRVVE